MAGDEPGLEWSAGSVAAMLGVSPTTLRTWDRRYGLGPSRREAGRHRRYDAGDVARLRRMLELTGQGVTPAAAAATVLGRPAPPRPRAGGGHGIVRVRTGGRRVQGLARAAARLDGPLLTRLVTDLLERFGVVDAWERLLVPYLVEIGEQTATGSLGVEVEHVVSAAIGEALGTVASPGEQGRLPVLLSCAPDEQHWLPCQALAAALAERDCPSRGLGARVPAEALIEAADRLDPLVIMVWAHTGQLARAVPLSGLNGRSLLVGGAGWDGLTLPDGARRVASLSTAVESVLALAGRTG